MGLSDEGTAPKTDKRQRILEAAMEEFASRGYKRAALDHIAEKAGVSVGLLFYYFESKEDLFLEIVRGGVEMIEESVGAVLKQEELDTASKIEQILRLIQESSRERKVLVRLYHELTSAAGGGLLENVSMNLESYTARAYEALLYEGQKRGEVRKDIDLRMAAFHLDNLFVQLQYAYSCEYFRQRFRIYVNPWVDQEIYDEKVIEESMKFIRGALLTDRKTDESEGRHEDFNL